MRTVTASNLACYRGGRQVFSGLGFTLKAGEFMEVRGPNGAGKSSLLRMIAGLNDPSAGTLGSDGGDAELTLGQQAHYIAHQDAIKPALTVSENLAFWARYLSGGAVAAVLPVFALEHLRDTPAALLSAGQKRRLALSRLAVARRPLWLLDEPSVGLDEASHRKLVALVLKHLADGGLVIATTHVPLGLEPHHILRIEPAGKAAA
ncbi:MAG TPA: heme ABC exporter ATP-binding protein CcmA [Aestuariivirga sp.]|nr:heme ABC exporter ATP-binding protein CcmA [Aestuariivirga sp.]